MSTYRYYAKLIMVTEKVNVVYKAIDLVSDNSKSVHICKMLNEFQYKANKLNLQMSIGRSFFRVKNLNTFQKKQNC